MEAFSSMPGQCAGWIMVHLWHHEILQCFGARFASTLVALAHLIVCGSTGASTQVLNGSFRGGSCYEMPMLWLSRSEVKQILGQTVLHSMGMTMYACLMKVGDS